MFGTKPVLICDSDKVLGSVGPWEAKLVYDLVRASPETVSPTVSELRSLLDDTDLHNKGVEYPSYQPQSISNLLAALSRGPDQDDSCCLSSN